MIAQAACVAYRPAPGGYEILLITTRKGKWTLPKGIIDPGEDAQETAAKEAYEEAGIVGRVEDEVVGTFEYHKWGEDLEVRVYLMEVTEFLPDFAESDFRRRAWLSPRAALDRIRSRMHGVLRDAVKRLDARFGV